MDYWKECIEEAFEGAGIAATKEQVDSVAGWAEGAHDNYGMANGYDAIPSPIDTEVEKLKEEINRINERHQIQLDGICKGVARRRNVDAGSVYIDDSGSVTYGT